MQILSTLLHVSRRLSLQSYEKFFTPPNNTTFFLLIVPQIVLLKSVSKQPHTLGGYFLIKTKSACAFASM